MRLFYVSLWLFYCMKAYKSINNDTDISTQAIHLLEELDILSTDINQIRSQLLVLKDSGVQLAKKQMDTCTVYQNLTYITMEEMYKNAPPLLLSFPGSGNTWMRLLIEYSTGIYSGSIYTDKELLDSLPGEKACGIRLVAIKGHPGDLILDKDNQVICSNRKMKAKCMRGLIRGWKRVIFVVRNPFDAAIADVNRELSYSHIGTAIGVQYTEKQRKIFVNNLILKVKYFSIEWETFVYPMLQALVPMNKVYIVYYEQLRDPIQLSRILNETITFMGWRQQSLLREEVVQGRLSCAPVLSTKPDIHRIHKMKNVDVLHHLSNSSLYSSYINVNSSMAAKSSLICAMWEHIKHYSQNFSYPLYDGIVC